MAIRFAVLLAALMLPAGAVAASAQPGAAAAKAPANADCLTCHEDVAKPFVSSTHAAASCVDCHADLSTVQEFPHAENVAEGQLRRLSRRHRVAGTTTASMRGRRKRPA